MSSAIDQPGGAPGDELHRVEGGLQGPGDVVDVALLVPADDLGSPRYPQPLGDHFGRGLHLDPRRGHARLAVLGADLGQVGGPLAHADPDRRVHREHGDERIHLHGDERSLTGPGLDKALAGKPLHGVPDGIPRGAVPYAQLKLCGQLAASREGTGVDLLPEILGDLLVHRLRHDSPLRIPATPTSHLDGLTGIYGTVWLVPTQTTQNRRKRPIGWDDPDDRVHQVSPISPAAWLQAVHPALSGGWVTRIHKAGGHRPLRWPDRRPKISWLVSGSCRRGRGTNDARVPKVGMTGRGWVDREIGLSHLG